MLKVIRKGKPRISKYVVGPMAWWVCKGQGIIAGGLNPVDAYLTWAKFAERDAG